jgi:hypothetical protein
VGSAAAPARLTSSLPYSDIRRYLSIIYVVKLK